MRLTKAKVDELHTLKQAADKAQAAYEQAISKIRAAGPAVYKGTSAALLIEEHTRKTVDSKAIFTEYNVPEDVIAEHTRCTAYTRAVFKAIT